MVIVWRLRGNIIRTAPCYCWVVWHNVHSQQHTHMSSSYRSSRLGLSHWDSYAVRRGGCLELYCCNTVEWSWWDSGFICKTNKFPSVLWHCWFGHMTCKNRPRYDYGTLNLALSIYLVSITVFSASAGNATARLGRRSVISTVCLGRRTHSGVDHVRTPTFLLSDSDGTLWYSLVICLCCYLFTLSLSETVQRDRNVLEYGELFLHLRAGTLL